MIDILSHNQTIFDLADAWEEEADQLEKWKPDSDMPEAIRGCAKALRSIARQMAPDEVPLPAVRDRTGWSDSWLASRVRELSEEGRARKRGRTWWIDRDAALGIPVKRGHRPHLEEGTDLSELAEHVLNMTTP